MKQLVILDYATGAVHFYPIDSDKCITEDDVVNLGHSLKNCEWIVGDLDIFYHKNTIV